MYPPTTKDPRRACGGILCPHPPKAGIVGAHSAHNGGILRQKSARVARKIGAPSARIPTRFAGRRATDQDPQGSPREVARRTD